MTEGEKKRFSVWRVLIGTMLLFAMVAVVAVYQAQPKLAFNPAPKLMATPALYNLEFKEVRVKKDGLSVAGWLVRAKKGSALGTVLFCHTSAGNRSYELDTCEFFSRIGFDVLTFDYPGFADSRGALSEQHCYEAASMLFDYLKEQKAADPVVVYGRARGAAIAAHLAQDRPVKALILEAAYPSLPELARHQLGMFRHLILWTFPIQTFLKNVPGPVLFVHSRDDREVPLAEGLRVFESYQGKKVFFETGGYHGEAVSVCAATYKEKLLNFLQESGLLPANKVQDPITNVQ